MNEEVKQLLIYETLMEACRFIRKYPPAQIPGGEDMNNFIIACADGKSDPDGLKYFQFFFHKAKRRLIEEGVLDK